MYFSYHNDKKILPAQYRLNKRTHFLMRTKEPIWFGHQDQSFSFLSLWTRAGIHLRGTFL